jgi:ankyrin repeat domain-containing protein 50
MELRDAERKRKPWKRWKRTSTEKAGRLKPTLSTAPTLTEPADQTAESPSTGKRGQNIQARDLWAEALKTLSKEDQAAFQAHSDSDLSILQHLYAIAEQKRDDCEKRGWKFKVNGRQIILRDLAQKIIVWIDKFKEVGDVVANFDPAHVALPWAGVRFLFQVRVESIALAGMKLILEKMTVAESQQMGALLIGVEKVTYLINRCKIYEILYLRDKRSGQAVTDLEPAETNPDPATKNPESAVMNLEPAVANLESALVTLYATMLRFLSTANQLYDKNVAARAIHGILNPDKVVSFVDECRSLERRVDIEAGNCERTYSRAKLGECGERLKQLLAGLQEPIVRVDSRVAALHDRLDESERSEILTWVSDIQYESNHYTARKERTDGTGEWLLRHERYQEWRGSSASTILWLHGIRRCRAFTLLAILTDEAY